jgi:hypothetical protein
MGKIIYNRGTTYTLTHNYTAPQYPGVTLIFTAKIVAFDADDNDSSNAIFEPKVVAMSGSTFPQTTVLTINPGDVDLNIPPKGYFYSVKVIDSDGGEYITSSGVFVLEVTTTNQI